MDGAIRAEESDEGSLAESGQFRIGSAVSCIDGSCGELRRVVVDPVARTLTHLVVEAKHRQGLGHLVPIDLVASAADVIQLRCTRSQFDTLEDAEETRFLQGATGQWGYGQDQMLSWPYYGLGIGPTGVGADAIITDRVPAGEVEVRRGEHVKATDGPIGRVQGLIVDPADHHVTHVLLDEGHLWGKKRVAIPINAVASVDDGVRLALTKDQVRDLPSINLADDQGQERTGDQPLSPLR
jgi:sporulation protein YlmC with PRC-barrel domain